MDQTGRGIPDLKNREGQCFEGWTAQQIRSRGDKSVRITPSVASPGPGTMPVPPEILVRPPRPASERNSGIQSEPVAILRQDVGAPERIRHRWRITPSLIPCGLWLAGPALLSLRYIFGTHKVARSGSIEQIQPLASLPPILGPPLRHTLHWRGMQPAQQGFFRRVAPRSPPRFGNGRRQW